MGSKDLLGVGSREERREEGREGIQSPGDRPWIFCRLTMVVTLNMAAYAPTTQGLCTVCALCKPGEHPDQG